MYTGTMMKDIDTIAERMEQRYSRVCSTCGQAFGKHSHDQAQCPGPDQIGAPLYLETTFTEYSIADKVRDEALGD